MTKQELQDRYDQLSVQYASALTDLMEARAQRDKARAQRDELAKTVQALCGYIKANQPAPQIGELVLRDIEQILANAKED